MSKNIVAKDKASALNGDDTGQCGRLSVKGAHFEKDGQKVFLSGVNQAWVAYGYDFGDNNYIYRRVAFENYLKMVYDNGGNSIRVWVHIEGVVSPHFDSSGHVTGLDQRGTFISDIKMYLHKAQQYNILIFFCLWNGALIQNHQHLEGLIKDTSKLQSYIDKALIPWVKAVKDEPAMGGWDIINEMEGEIKPGVTHSEPCFDSNFLLNSGAGWAGRKYTPQEFLRFINWQADAIRRTDPHALVTAGSWNARSNVDQWGGCNLYKDSCLRKAGGKHLGKLPEPSDFGVIEQRLNQHDLICLCGERMGTLTFYSSHSYAWQGKYDKYAPFKHSFADYSLDKPLVVAEFSQVSGAGMTITEQFNYLYTHGYAGGWTWHALGTGFNSDSTATQMKGLKFMKGKNNQQQGGLINFKLFEDVFFEFFQLFKE